MFLEDNVWGEHVGGAEGSDAVTTDYLHVVIQGFRGVIEASTVKTVDQ